MFILSTAIIVSKYMTRKIVVLGRTIIFVGLVIALLFGLHEFYYVTHERIKLTADAASSSSYMILFMYTTYLTLSKVRCAVSGFLSIFCGSNHFRAVDVM